MNRIFVAFIFVLSVFGCSQQKFISSKWEKQSFKELSSISVFDYLYDNDGKLFYLITNDSTNLYIHLKAGDEVAQKKIVRFGFTVWLDTTAKNNKQMGVKFPLPENERMGGIADGNKSKRNRRDFDEYKNQMANQVMEIELIGFSGKNSSQYVSAINNKTVRGKMQFSENGDILFLISIPFKNIGVKYKPGMYLSINLVSGCLSEEMRPEGMAGGRPGGMGGGRQGGMSSGRPGGAGGSHPGGMSGGRPGGMSGGQNPQRMQERQQLSTPIKIQLKKAKLF